MNGEGFTWNEPLTKYYQPLTANWQLIFTHYTPNIYFFVPLYHD